MDSNDYEDFNVNLIAQYNDTFLGFATIYQPFSAEETSKYIAQVFNAMIHIGLVSKPSEKMIFLCMFIPTNTSSFIIVARNKKDAMSINDSNITNIIELTKNHPIGDNIYSFNINIDLSKPISCKFINLAEMNEGIKEIFSKKNMEDTNKNKIEYIITIKPSKNDH